MIAQEHAPSYQHSTAAAHPDGLPSSSPWPCSYFRHGLLLWGEAGAAARVAGAAAGPGRADGGAGLLNGNQRRGRRRATSFDSTVTLARCEQRTRG